MQESVDGDIGTDKSTTVENMSTIFLQLSRFVIGDLSNLFLWGIVHYLRHSRHSGRLDGKLNSFKYQPFSVPYSGIPLFVMRLHPNRVDKPQLHRQKDIYMNKDMYCIDKVSKRELTRQTLLVLTRSAKLHSVVPQACY